MEDGCKVTQAFFFIPGQPGYWVTYICCRPQTFHLWCVILSQKGGQSLFQSTHRIADPQCYQELIQPRLCHRKGICPEERTAASHLSLWLYVTGVSCRAEIVADCLMAWQPGLRDQRQPRSPVLNIVYLYVIVWSAEKTSLWFSCHVTQEN